MSRLTGSTPLIAGQQSYAIVFSPAFSLPPVFFPSVQMPSSSGEIFFANADVSTLTASGVTVWLSGLPTSASVGGNVTWEAEGAASGTTVSTDLQGGITLPQLVHRIARKSRTGDFTKLSMTELSDVFEAANTGLQKVYNSLPTYFKEQTQGFVLPPPATISTTVTQYSKTVGAATFTAAQLGATVRLDGDPQWNQVLGTAELLNPYLGSTGTVSGTVYGDSIFTDTYPLDRIIGNPKFSNPNLNIYGIGPITGPGWWGSGLYGAWLLVQSTGVPCYWWPQVMGNSQGRAPIVILKFAPLPNVAYAVNVRLSFWPKRVTLQDYLNATTLPVPSQFIEPGLIPLCLEAYMSSPSWRASPDDPRVIERATFAEDYLRGQPAQIGPPGNRIFCPVGF